MKMKKFVSLVLCVVMMMSLLVTTAFAMGEEELYLKAEGDAIVGQTVTVYVYNNDLTADSLAAHFTFDNAALECVSIVGSRAGRTELFLKDSYDDYVKANASSTVDEANDSGRVGFGWAGSDKVDYQAGLIATVTFKVVAEPAEDLKFVLNGDHAGEISPDSNATVQKPTPPPPHVCVFDQQVATDAYKATDADCTKKATYYYSCECGASENDPNHTFEAGKKGNHTDADNNKRCDVCNKDLRNWTPAPDVESPKTFDAGAAMYIGVTLLAAAGSAVVLKKKD